MVQIQSVNSTNRVSVTTNANLQNNSVTASNSQAQYFSEQAQEYANEAKGYRDEAEQFVAYVSSGAGSAVVQVQQAAEDALDEIKSEAADILNVVGRAKEWAISDEIVEDEDYSSKYYANQSKTYSETSVSSATSASASAGSAQTYADTAKDWAVKSDGAVETGLYSAKYYAEQASSVAGSFSASVEDIIDDVEEAGTTAVTNIQNAASTASSTISGYVTQAETYAVNAETYAGQAETSATQAAASASQAQAIAESMSVTPATETTAGIVQLATTAEVDAGTNDTKVVTPLKLNGVMTTLASAVVANIQTVSSNISAEQTRAQAAESSLQSSINQINTTLTGKANADDLADVATSGSYTDLADTPSIPSKVSQLENDTGFITASSIPSDYVTSEQLTNAGYLTASSAAETYATKTEVSLKADESALSSLQPVTDNSLSTTNKTITGAINELNTELESKADTADLSAYLTTVGAADTYLTISDAADTYATKTELNTKANTSDIPTKVSDLTNDAGYISSIPGEYITETELSTELSSYAKTSDVVKKSGDTMTGALTINRSGTSLTTSGSASINSMLTVGAMSYLKSNVYIGDSDTYFAGNAVVMSKGLSDDNVYCAKMGLNYDGAAKVSHSQGTSENAAPDSYILLDAENLKYVTSGTNGNTSYLTTYNIMTSQNSYTKTEVDSLIASAGSGGTVDLTNYVTKNDFEELEDTVGDIGTLLDTINGEAV